MSGVPDDDLRALIEGLSDDEIADLIDTLPEPAVAALESLMGGVRDHSTLPATPAEEARHIDAGYRDRAHLTYLSERLAVAVKDVEEGRSRYLRVSMPPRSGKSLLISVYFLIWLLRRHPDWPIGLISHSPTLATGWGRTVRRVIEEDGKALGIALAPDAGAASNWETTEGGGVTARSAPGQSITGLGFKVLVVDDGVKDFAAAHSAVQRDALWDWWKANAITRLEPPALVVVVGCLTYDTPVLMADGIERLIGEVRPGDLVMTYADGELATAPVVNWANMGADHVYSITMESGRSVRANAKHPFLTVDDEGNEAWLRTDQLAPGLRVRSVGGHGQEWPVQSATSRPDARASASPTTTRPDGPQVTDGKMPSIIDAPTSGIATGSTPRTTGSCSTPKTVYARSASGLLLPRTHVGRESCSWTTAMTGIECGDSCATTATSSSDTGPRSSDCSQPPSTYELTTDRIVSVEITGHEDVFDVEVEGTHTFVANGLVTHNTRWHEDDLLGRLGSTEYEGDPDDWEVISFPALAETHDVLGRAEGEPLISPLLDETPAEALSRWAAIAKSVGSYGWAALYQQRPAPAKGAIFDIGWWKFWTTDPDKATEDGSVIYLHPEEIGGSGRWLDSWDMAFKGASTSDYVVGQRWVHHGVKRILVAQTRARRTFTETLKEMRWWGRSGPDTTDPVKREPDPRLALPTSRFVRKRIVEDKANGTAVIDVLKDEISGLVPVNPTDSKEGRARAVTPLAEAGNVYLPHPTDPGNEWVLADLLPELRDFPLGSHDDSVDALTQALADMQDEGTASITVPGRTDHRVPDRQKSAGRQPVPKGGRGAGSRSIIRSVGR